LLIVFRVSLSDLHFIDLKSRAAFVSILFPRFLAFSESEFYLKPPFQALKTFDFQFFQLENVFRVQLLLSTLSFLFSAMLTFIYDMIFHLL